MYFQYPNVHKDYLVFVSGNALWVKTHATDVPYRLTETMAGLRWPVCSADGKTLAFVAENDVYTLPLDGGVPNRITAYEYDVTLLGWKDDQTLWIVTNAISAFRENTLATIDVKTGQRHSINVGPCEFASFNARGGQVIQRQGYGYTSWKRYTGGTAGTLWVDVEGSGAFKPLLPDVRHNLLRPFWVKNRIYFLSDKEGHGNVYSCQPDGSDVRRHTNHMDFYPRHLASDGHHLVYSCGGKIWLYDTEKEQESLVSIQLNPGALFKVLQSKNPATHLTSYQVSCDGKRLALTTRGRLFEMTPSRGPVTQKGLRDGVRYRWVSWLKDKTLVALCDQGLNEVFECYSPDHLERISCHPKTPNNGDWGRIISAKANPQQRTLVCTNHRHELLLIHLDEDKSTLIDFSEKGPIEEYDWSACGRWIAYSIASRYRGARICIYDTQDHVKHVITDDAFMNTHPVFDPDGKYLFFLSSRRFDPNWDGIHMTMMCQEGTQPFVFILQANEESPFVLPLLQTSEDEDEAKDGVKDENKDKDGGSGLSPGAEKEDTIPGEAQKKEDAVPGEAQKKEEKNTPKPVVIDFTNPASRILAFPLAPKAYTHLAALKGQVLYCTQDEDGKNDLHAYDLKQLKEDLWVSSIESFSFSLDRQWMVYKSNGRLRTLRAGSKPDDGPDTSFHQGGWLDWTRVVLMTHPQKEWIHMFDEAWRLQKEMFWMPSMGKIDWQEVYERYRPCVDQITCQSEIYSVISDMQGELGTSHAYVMAHGKSKDSTLGSLGADFSFSPEHGAYRIDKFLQGDLWSDLPLQRPGLGLSQGDLIWAIGGQNLSQEIHPCHGLIQQSGNSVPIVVSNSLGENKRTLVVFPKSASKDHKWRYRQWVETNRQWVHKNSNGLVGYIHIPDMGPFGYSEFLRGYTQEFDRDGLIIDARYNGGGNLSYFMIDVLRRKRLGYDQSRHQGLFPYPGDSPKGPMVALVNEYTGSDGDIFSHAFKALDMGPLIGKRTWGGVVGIWPRYDLIDGTRTSQPEYSFWFHDIGWCVENTGVSPTIEVDITPQDYGQNRDPQLARGLEEVQLRILQDMARQEGLLPASGVEPCLAPPMNLGSKGSAD